MGYIDLNKLKTFYTLCQVKNYSKCARKLYVTQSAVSHAIRALESSLELALVQKNKSGFALTDEGRVLLKSCQVIFSELDKTSRTLLESRDYPEVIRLGAPVEFGVSIVINSIKGFFDRHCGIHIDFRLSHDLLKPLLDDELDLIVDCRPHAHPELRVIHLFQEEYAVVASAAYLRRHEVATPADLGRCNILSLDKDLSWWGNFIHALPGNRQVVFDKVTEINHVRGLINAAICGLGVAFVPTYTIGGELARGDLIALFPEMDILNDHVNIYIKRHKADLAKCRALIAYIKGFKLP